MNNITIITYQEVSFMEPVPCKNNPQAPLVLGRCVDHPKTLAVSVTIGDRHGVGMLYCETHQLIYRPTATCPACDGSQSEPA